MSNIHTLEDVIDQIVKERMAAKMKKSGGGDASVQRRLS